jgi:hypothetical protein
LGLGMAGRAMNVRHTAVQEPFGGIVRDVVQSIVAEQSWFVRDLGCGSLKPPISAQAYR